MRENCMREDKELPIDFYDEKIKRNKEIVDKVESGMPLSQVCKDYGITRQRAHQIHQRGKPSHKDLLHLSDWCKLTNTPRTTAVSLIESGKLPYKKIGARYYINKDVR